MKTLLTVFCVTAAVAMPVVARADDGGGDYRGGETRYERRESSTVVFVPGIFTTTTASWMPYLLTTGAGGLTTTGILGVPMTTTRMLLPKGLAFGQMVAYLKVNHRALEEDLLIGGGSAVDDLAFLVEVAEEDRAGFGRRLREHREELLPYLHEDLDQDDARAFLMQVLRIRRDGGSVG